MKRTLKSPFFFFIHQTVELKVFKNGDLVFEVYTSGLRKPQGFNPGMNQY